MTRIILFFFTFLFSVLSTNFTLASNQTPAKNTYSTFAVCNTLHNDFQFNDLNHAPDFIELTDEEVNENETENDSYAADKKSSQNNYLAFLKFFEKSTQRPNAPRFYLNQQRYLFIFISVFRL